MEDYNININQTLILLGETTVKLRLCEDRFESFKQSAMDELAQKNQRISELEQQLEAAVSENQTVIPEAPIPPED